jgi:large subunit ribosomal protein L13e
LSENVARLKAYKAKLILFPRKVGQHKKEDSKPEELKHENIGRKSAHVLPIKNATIASVYTERKIEKGDGTENAYKLLRETRAEARYAGAKDARKKAKEAEKEKK